MSSSPKVIATVSIAVLSLAAAAQMAPICCKYLYSWPAEGNPGGDGACSGIESMSCETAAIEPGGGSDPLARQYGPLRDALCYHVILHGSGSYFVRQACTLPKPSPTARLIGVLPNGVCCYVDGFGPDIDIQEIPREFKVPDCLGVCLMSPT